MKLSNNQKRVLAQASRILEKIAAYEAITVDNPQVISDIFSRRLQGQNIEIFSVAFLNTKNQIIQIEDLSTGTIDAASVYPREVIKRCLELDAKAIVISHNHPSGSLEFSGADVYITEKLTTACDVLDIRLLDHILVAGGRSMSMAQVQGMP